MRVHILKLKAELKVLATEIRQLKLKRKELRGYVPNLLWSQQQFRIKHIAYCMLRGRSLEQIEPKLRDPRDYNHTYVRQQAAKIINEIMNPKPPVEEPKEEKKETLWSKVTSFLS